MATITPEPAPQEPAETDATARVLTRERLKRDDPQRTGPIRNATTYFRESHSWSDGAPDPDGPEPITPAAETLDDVITRGVHLGYKVIEEHLRKGQDTARQLRHERPDAEPETADIEAFVAQAQRLYQDLGTLCFDAIDTLGRSPALLRSLLRTLQPAATDSPAAPSGPPSAERTAQSVRFALDIASRLPSRIELRVDAEPLPERLRVHALHAASPEAPPLTAIEVRQEPGSRCLLLQVRVPDPQPPGFYTGVVVDAETNAPVGTLTVRLSASAAS